MRSKSILVRWALSGSALLVCAACHHADPSADPAADAKARCASARSAALDAWRAALPPLQKAAEDAQKAASNCDGPTRDQPPCSGQMSERFVVQSVTAAKLLEVERARDATADGGALDMREASRLAKDDPKIQPAKESTEAAFDACKSVAP